VRCITESFTCDENHALLMYLSTLVKAENAGNAVSARLFLASFGLIGPIHLYRGLPYMDGCLYLLVHTNRCSYIRQDYQLYRSEFRDLRFEKTTMALPGAVVIVRRDRGHRPQMLSSHKF